ncbi:MAG: hypothetical protein H0X59_06095 [Chloroflexi bacterium]|nr:hypothetical protein [Chloroflexota bacterium]MDQ3407440.1 hypothetical protein [Chloroflexota bacterium]
MTRRGLGRGRLLMGLGAVIALISMPLDWFKVGGQVTSITPISGNGFEGAGILVFVVAVALLAVLVLPYASRYGRSAWDRPTTYLLLTGVGIAGLVLRIVQLAGEGILGTPDRAPGLYLAGAGLVVVAWGIAEMLGERPAAL